MSCCSKPPEKINFYTTGQQVYNSLQFVNDPPTLIDIRPLAEYLKMHIHRAINIPIAQSQVASSLTDIVAAVGKDHQTVFNRRSENADICIYGTPADIGAALHLRDLLLKENELYVIWILQAGFVGFQQDYSFMCDNISVRDSYLSEFRPFPCEVLANQIYLGGIREAMHLENLEMMGIQGVICMTKTRENPFADKLTYLNWSSDETINSIFNKAFDFIREHLRQGGKVLIHCRYGNVASASLVMAYLVATERQTLLQAFTTVTTCKGTIDPTYGKNRCSSVFWFHCHFSCCLYNLLSRHLYRLCCCGVCRGVAGTC